MTEALHTPKPWTVRQTSRGYVVEHNFKMANGSPDAIYVAVCANYSPNVDDRANAEFIATAPEMLEFIAKLTDIPVNGEADVMLDWIEQQACIILAKARGETA